MLIEEEIHWDLSFLKSGICCILSNKSKIPSPYQISTDLPFSMACIVKHYQPEYLSLREKIFFSAIIIKRLLIPHLIWVTVVLNGG